MKNITCFSKLSIALVIFTISMTNSAKSQLMLKGNGDLDVNTFSNAGGSVSIGMTAGFEKGFGGNVAIGGDLGLWFAGLGGTMLYIDAVGKYYSDDDMTKGINGGIYGGLGFASGTNYYNGGAEVGYGIPITDGLALMLHARAGLALLSYGYYNYYYGYTTNSHSFGVNLAGGGSLVYVFK